MPRKTEEQNHFSPASLRRALLKLCREKAELELEIRQLHAAIEMYREVARRLTATNAE